MWNAALWGTISGSAVLLGALTAFFMTIKKQVIGWIMAFGTGTLIGAAAYGLLHDSIQDGGVQATSIGFLTGALTFTIFDILISKKGAGKRKRSLTRHSAGINGTAIFVGTLMDAIPESIMIGASLLEKDSVSWLLVAAIFISNFPEGLSSTIGMKINGYSFLRIFCQWFCVVVISAFSALGGYLFLENASPAILSAIAAFAGGGIIAMVASTMMPEAFEEGGSVTGFISALGVLASLILDFLET